MLTTTVLALPDASVHRTDVSHGRMRNSPNTSPEMPSEYRRSDGSSSHTASEVEPRRPALESDGDDDDRFRAEGNDGTNSANDVRAYSRAWSDPKAGHLESTIHGAAVYEHTTYTQQRQQLLSSSYPLRRRLPLESCW